LQFFEGVVGALLEGGALVLGVRHEPKVASLGVQSRVYVKTGVRGSA
jgi:hypothetical protein